jgi:small-conductance mechanosensitive channel/CRP-like cAMP-binding protein
MLEQLPSTRDALIIVGATAGIYIVLVAAAQLLRRGKDLRFGWTYHLFALAAGLFAGLSFSTWRTDLALQVIRHTNAATLVLASFPLIALVNRFWWATGRKEARRGDAPRVLADATGMVFFAVALLVALQLFYDVKVPGLVAGSGVIAIVIGLAMQDLLGNLLAGVALYFEKSFQTGDWLLIHDQRAKVIEISWRSTRLLTTDDVLIDVPNSDIVKQAIYNFELPTPQHAVRATIGLHYDVPPARVQEVLKEAAASVPGVRSTPEPRVYLSDFADSSIVYEIKVWIDDDAQRTRILSDLRVHAWYAVKRAGMEIPYPQMVLHRARPADTLGAARATAAAALRGHATFGSLTAEQIDGLVRESPVVLFAPNEHLIEQGDAAGSMFLIVRGRVDVQITHHEQTNVVAQLGSGACLGEMSLLTGEARTATVIARVEVEAVEILPTTFGAFVRANPEVLGRLSELLAERQLANEKITSAALTDARRADTRASVLKKLRAFFQLGD